MPSNTENPIPIGIFASELSPHTEKIEKRIGEIVKQNGDPERIIPDYKIRALISSLTARIMSDLKALPDIETKQPSETDEFLKEIKSKSDAERERFAQAFKGWQSLTPNDHQLIAASIAGNYDETETAFEIFEQVTAQITDAFRILSAPPAKGDSNLTNPIPRRLTKEAFKLFVALGFGKEKLSTGTEQPLYQIIETYRIELKVKPFHIPKTIQNHIGIGTKGADWQGLFDEVKNSLQSQHPKTSNNPPSPPLFEHHMQRKNHRPCV